MPKFSLSLDIGKSRTQASLFAQRDGAWAVESIASVPTAIEHSCVRETRTSWAVERRGAPLNDRSQLTTSAGWRARRILSG